MSQDIKLSSNPKEIIIGPGRAPELIAEAGVLTWGDKGRGFLFVDDALKAGVKLLKFQCMSADNVVGRDYPWHERLKQRELKKETFLEIMEYGKIRGITVFASTHNEYDMIELSNAGMQVLKLGAGDSNNIRMIDMCLKTGKPVILSIGLLRRGEIFELLERYKNQAHQLIILWCRTMYPTPPEAASLGFLKILKEKFPQFNFGYSDHSAGDTVPLIAGTMSEVCLIEKHICFPEDRISPKYLSWDINGALTAQEMRALTHKIKDARSAILDNEKHDEIMIANRNWAHKSIIAKRDISANKAIEADDLMTLRPYEKEKGFISCKDFYSIVGKSAKKDFKAGEYLLREDFLENPENFL